jgi:hypothetical protein
MAGEPELAAAAQRLTTPRGWDHYEMDRESDASATPLADRCTAATESFLAAMRAAGNPGATKAPFPSGSGLRRTRRPHAWVLRPVGRENADPMHYEYEPGLLLTTEGRFHRLESEVRGWGQARFPHYVDTANPDPTDMPVEERLIEELATVLRDNDVIAQQEP